MEKQDGFKLMFVASVRNPFARAVLGSMDRSHELVGFGCARRFVQGGSSTHVW